MTKVKNIIREARGKRNQHDFAALIGKTQGLVSKYENGTVSPPSDVLEQCWSILQKNNDADITVDALTKRIRNELKEPQLAFARKSIATLLDGIQLNSRN